MKKDKYPLGSGLMPSDPSRPGSASLGARDMYSSMNGYMPNGYGYDSSSMYSSGTAGYPPSHMSSSPSSLYSRYDMTGGMYSPSSTTASAMSSYMNGSYMSMYGTGGGSPYSMQGGPLSPEEGGEGGGVVTSHPSHSPGSVKSEAGGSGAGLPQGSPGTAAPTLHSVPPPAGSAGAPPAVKREPGGGAGPGGQPDLNRMISMYLPGDAAAAAAGDPHAQSRINTLTNQVYAGHYSGLMTAGPPHSHSPDPASMAALPPASAYPV